MPTFWAFIGVFCAILVLEVTVTHVPSFESHGVPIIVGSFVSLVVDWFFLAEQHAYAYDAY